MKLAFQLAYKNLIGAGLRTWLNVGVLAFSFIIIIFYNGLIDGWNEQAKHDSIAWEFGEGKLLHADYDPFDPFTILDGHGVLEKEQLENLTPILLRQASIYPEGRMLSVALKGIDVNQTTLDLPTAALKNSLASIPAVIGRNMADAANLETGDKILLRWRDQGGTFDAAKITIVEVFETNVPTVDGGQVWIPIKKMWKMTGLENHATFYVANEKYQPSKISGWKYQSQEMLLSDLNEIIAMKKISGSIMYLLLLAIALLAIFDTQVLSVFRRQKEIGTYISLGMTRSQVVGLFTVEGSMYSIFAMILGSIVGIPLFAYLSKIGIGMPAASRDMGIPLAERIYPVFGIQLVIGTILLVVIAATIVSFLPARKISRMNPALALKGKLQ
jgi:putative ABC transport system permease protein